MLKNDWFMSNKLIYWIPIVGMFVSLAKFDQEVELGPVWPYYQAVMILAIIWIITFIVI
jgi:hypothetical protein